MVVILLHDLQHLYFMHLDSLSEINLRLLLNKPTYRKIKLLNHSGNVFLPFFFQYPVLLPPINLIGYPLNGKKPEGLKTCDIKI